MNKGNLFVISGPSGTGKGTVVKKLVSNEESVCLSVSATTRAPREGERDGVEYHFISKEKFEEMISSNDVIEYTTYCGNYYGTPKKFTEQKLKENKNVILEIEVDGGSQIRSLYEGAVSIFVVPPSMQELEKRLRGRGTESDEVVKKRLSEAYNELKQAENYDYIVINDDVDTCVESIIGIIKSEKMRKDNMIDFVKDVLLNA